MTDQRFDFGAARRQLTDDNLRQSLQAQAETATDPLTKRQIAKQIDGLQPLGLSEGWGRTFTGKEATFWDYVPFVSAVRGAKEVEQLEFALDRMSHGAGTDDDENLVRQFWNEQTKQKTFGYEVGRIAAGALPFAGEFWLTRGAYGKLAQAGAWASKAPQLAKATQLMTTMAQPFQRFGQATRALAASRPVVGNVALALAVEGPKQLMGQLVIGETIGGSRVRAGMYTNYIANRYGIDARDDYELAVRIADDSYGMWTNALPAALVDNYIEMFSEAVGDALLHLPAALKFALFQGTNVPEAVTKLGKAAAAGAASGRFSNRLLSFLGLSADRKYYGLWSDLGFQGIVPEIGEEFVGSMTRDVVHAVAPDLAEGGNTEYLFKNLPAVALGMGLGMFGPAAATTALTRMDYMMGGGDEMKEAQRQLRLLMKYAEREGLEDLGRDLIDISRLINQGAGAPGTGRIASDQFIRNRFLDSQIVRDEAVDRIHNKAAQDRVVPDVSRENVENEMMLMLEEANRLQFEGKGWGNEADVSPYISRMLELGVIDEEEAGRLDARFMSRLNKLRQAVMDGRLEEFAIMAGNAEARAMLADMKSRGIEDKNLLTLNVAAVHAARARLARTIIEGSSNSHENGPFIRGDVRRAIAALTALEPLTPEGLSEVRRIPLPSVEAANRVMAAKQALVARLDRSMTLAVTLDPRPVEARALRHLAGQLGLQIIRVNAGTTGGFVAEWDEEHRVLYIDEAKIQRKAKKLGLDPEELVGTVVMHEMIHIHGQRLGPERREIWIRRLDRVLTEAGFPASSVADKMRNGLYDHLEGDTLAQLEESVAHRVAPFGKALWGERAQVKDPGIIRKAFQWFMDEMHMWFLPNTFAQKQFLRQRDALEAAGIDISEMSNSQVSMALSTLGHLGRLFDLPGARQADAIFNTTQQVEDMLRGVDEPLEAASDSAPSVPETVGEDAPENAAINDVVEDIKPMQEEFDFTPAEEDQTEQLPEDVPVEKLAIDSMRAHELKPLLEDHLGFELEPREDGKAVPAKLLRRALKFRMGLIEIPRESDVKRLSKAVGADLTADAQTRVEPQEEAAETQETPDLLTEARSRIDDDAGDAPQVAEAETKPEPETGPSLLEQARQRIDDDAGDAPQEAAPEPSQLEQGQRELRLIEDRIALTRSVVDDLAVTDTDGVIEEAASLIADRDDREGFLRNVNQNPDDLDYFLDKLNAEIRFAVQLARETVGPRATQQEIDEAKKFVPAVLEMLRRRGFLVMWPAEFATGYTYELSGFEVEHRREVDELVWAHPAIIAIGQDKLRDGYSEGLVLLPMDHAKVEKIEADVEPEDLETFRNWNRILKETDRSEREQDLDIRERLRDFIGEQGGQAAEQAPLVIDWFGEDAGDAPQPQPVVVDTMRRGNRVEQYGNPFGARMGRGVVKTVATTQEAVDAYRAWLEGTDHANVAQERRDWILGQIDSGALDGAVLTYRLNRQFGTEQGQYRNHAEELRDFINERRPEANVTLRLTGRPETVFDAPGMPPIFAEDMPGIYGSDIPEEQEAQPQPSLLEQARTQIEDDAADQIVTAEEVESPEMPRQEVRPGKPLFYDYALDEALPDDFDTGLEVFSNVLTETEMRKIERIVELAVSEDAGYAEQLRGETLQRNTGKNKRTQLSFGAKYEYGFGERTKGVYDDEVEVEPLPKFMKVIIDRMIEAGYLTEEERPNSALINVYERGNSWIPPHNDLAGDKTRARFTEPITTIRFGANTVMTFGYTNSYEGGRMAVPTVQNPAQKGKQRHGVQLPRGSIAIMRGEAATEYNHSIMREHTTEGRSFSITLRRVDWGTEKPKLAPENTPSLLDQISADITAKRQPQPKPEPAVPQQLELPGQDEPAELVPLPKLQQTDETSPIGWAMKIISGGQTGADTAGLIAAQEMGLETGGYIGKDLKRETRDGLNGKQITSQFGLTPTTQEGKKGLKERTIGNAQAADGTVIFAKDTSSPGTLQTTSRAAQRGKPHPLFNPTAEQLANWIITYNIHVLNVAGNRLGRGFTDRDQALTVKTIKDALKLVGQYRYSGEARRIEALSNEAYGLGRTGREFSLREMSDNIVEQGVKTAGSYDEEAVYIYEGPDGDVQIMDPNYQLPMFYMHTARLEQVEETETREDGGTTIRYVLVPGQRALHYGKLRVTDEQALREVEVVADNGDGSVQVRPIDINLQNVSFKIYKRALYDRDSALILSGQTPLFDTEGNKIRGTEPDQYELTDFEAEIPPPPVSFSPRLQLIARANTTAGAVETRYRRPKLNRMEAKALQRYLRAVKEARRLQAEEQELNLETGYLRWRTYDGQVLHKFDLDVDGVGLTLREEVSSVGRRLSGSVANRQGLLPLGVDARPKTGQRRKPTQGQTGRKDQERVRDDDVVKAEARAAFWPILGRYLGGLDATALRKLVRIRSKEGEGVGITFDVELAQRMMGRAEEGDIATAAEQALVETAEAEIAIEHLLKPIEAVITEMYRSGDAFVIQARLDSLERHLAQLAKRTGPPTADQQAEVLQLEQQKELLESLRDEAQNVLGVAFEDLVTTARSVVMTEGGLADIQEAEDFDPGEDDEAEAKADVMQQARPASPAGRVFAGVNQVQLEEMTGRYIINLLSRGGEVASRMQQLRRKLREGELQALDNRELELLSPWWMRWFVLSAGEDSTLMQTFAVASAYAPRGESPWDVPKARRVMQNQALRSSPLTRGLGAIGRVGRGPVRKNEQADMLISVMSSSTTEDLLNAWLPAEAVTTSMEPRTLELVNTAVADAVRNDWLSVTTSALWNEEQKASLDAWRRKHQDAIIELAEKPLRSRERGSEKLRRGRQQALVELRNLPAMKTLLGQRILAVHDAILATNLAMSYAQQAGYYMGRATRQADGMATAVAQMGAAVSDSIIVTLNEEVGLLGRVVEYLQEGKYGSARELMRDMHERAPMLQLATSNALQVPLDASLQESVRKAEAGQIDVQGRKTSYDVVEAEGEGIRIVYALNPMVVYGLNVAPMTYTRRPSFDSRIGKDDLREDVVAQPTTMLGMMKAAMVEERKHRTQNLYDGVMEALRDAPNTPQGLRDAIKKVVSDHLAAIREANQAAVDYNNKNKIPRYLDVPLKPGEPRTTSEQIEAEKRGQTPTKRVFNPDFRLKPDPRSDAELQRYAQNLQSALLSRLNTELAKPAPHRKIGAAVFAALRDHGRVSITLSGNKITIASELDAAKRMTIGISQTTVSSDLVAEPVPHVVYTLGTEGMDDSPEAKDDRAALFRYVMKFIRQVHQINNAQPETRYKDAYLIQLPEDMQDPEIYMPVMRPGQDLVDFGAGKMIEGGAIKGQFKAVPENKQRLRRFMADPFYDEAEDDRRGMPVNGMNNPGYIIPDIWDLDKMPKGADDEWSANAFVMAYDEWFRQTNRNVYDANLAMADFHDAIERFVDDEAREQGLPKDMRKFKRIDEINRALLIAINVKGYLTEAGWKEVARLGYNVKAMSRPETFDDWVDYLQLLKKLQDKRIADGKGLGENEQRMVELTPEFLKVMDVAKQIFEGEGRFAQLGFGEEGLAYAIVEKAKETTAAAKRGGLISTEQEYYISLLWEDTDLRPEFEIVDYGMQEPTSAGGPMARSVGYRAKRRTILGVIHGEMLGKRLTRPGAVESWHRSARRINESLLNRAFIEGLKGIGAIRPIDKRGRAKGYDEITVTGMRGYQAEKWIAKYLNNAMTQFGIKDIENPVYRNYMRLTIAAKHLMLMFGFFHHQAFLRSYLFTVQRQDAKPGSFKQLFRELGMIAKASALSYGRAFGWVSKERLEAVASEFTPYRVGNASVADRKWWIELGVEEGLTIQKGNEIAGSQAGALYDLEDKEAADAWVRKAFDRIAGWAMSDDLKQRAYEFIEKFRRAQFETAQWLFNSLGANLKAAAYMSEVDELMKKNFDWVKNDTDGSRKRALARKAAMKVNADFGGLNLKAREGKATDYFGYGGPRNPRTQMMLRALILAPDWTESNLVTILGMLKGADVLGQPDMLKDIEKNMYRHMWIRVGSRALAIHFVINLLMAGIDPERDLYDLYKEAGFFGQEGDKSIPKWSKFRWLDANFSLFSPTESNKFVSVLGHFGDPLKWTTDFFFDSPIAPLERKGSVAARAVAEFITGADYSGRRFTTFREIMGIDYDAGVYQRKTTLKDGTVMLPGDSKAGKYAGKLSRFSVETGAVNLEQIFGGGYLWTQLFKFAPLQARGMMEYITGQKDGFDFLMEFTGTKYGRTYPQ